VSGRAAVIRRGRQLCAASLLTLAAAVPAYGQQIGVAVGNASTTSVAPGGTISIPIVVDMTAAGGLDLASLSFDVQWDAARLSFVSSAPGSFGTVTLNETQTASGALTAAIFNPTGTTNSFTALTLTLQAGALEGSTPITIQATAAGNGAGQNILSNIVTSDLSLCVGLLGLFGDVTGDDAVNIIDAQQIARFSVGLSVTDPARMVTHGDVTADGNVNIIDAQQVARASIGLPTSGRTGTPVSGGCSGPPPPGSGPVVQSITPASGNVGDQVTLDGQGLMGSATVVNILVGTVRVVDATPFIESLSAAQIVLKMPNVGIAGTFDVVVTVDGVTSAPVQWTQLADNELSEPNDTPATATPVTFPLDVVGSFQGSDVDDFYGFTLAVQSTVDVALDWNKTSKDLDILIVDGAFTQFECVDGATLAKPESSSCTLAAGDHLLLINDFSAENAGDSTVVSYEVTVATPVPLPASATITAPASGTNFFQGDLITFSGSGADAMGAPITGSSLVWASDLDGQIGMGATFSTSALSVGAHMITLTATNSQGQSGSTSISIGVNAPSQAGYQIEIQFLAGSGGTASQKQALLDAASRWEGLVIGDVPDVTFSNAQSCGPSLVTKQVDDLLIFAQFVPIDGPSGILGQAGPCIFRSAGMLPIEGFMQFDIDDVAALEASGQLTSVFLHEMGHVIGIGSRWSAFGLLQNPSSTSGPIVDTHMNGPRAIAAFDGGGGTGYTAGAKVPAENDNTVWGAGSLNGHWRESVLGNELMTPGLNSGFNPLSAISVESLADLGYMVDASAADPFALTFPLRAGPAGPLIMLKDDIWAGPQAIVYPDGRIVPLPRR